MTVDPRDVGQVLVTRHALVQVPELAEYSDPNPLTGDEHVPLEAVLERPGPDLRLYDLQIRGDGWAYATWVSDRLTKFRVDELPDGWDLQPDFSERVRGAWARGQGQQRVYRSPGPTKSERPPPAPVKRPNPTRVTRRGW